MLKIDNSDNDIIQLLLIFQSHHSICSNLLKFLQCDFFYEMDIS